MQSFRIIKGLDVPEYVAPDLFPGAVLPVMNELVLQRAVRLAWLERRRRPAGREHG